VRRGAGQLQQLLLRRIGVEGHDDARLAAGQRAPQLAQLARPQAFLGRLRFLPVGQRRGRLEALGQGLLLQQHPEAILVGVDLLLDALALLLQQPGVGHPASILASVQFAFVRQPHVLGEHAVVEVVEGLDEVQPVGHRRVGLIGAVAHVEGPVVDIELQEEAQEEGADQEHEGEEARPVAAEASPAAHCSPP